MGRPVYRVDGLDGDAGLVSPLPNVLVIAPQDEEKPDELGVRLRGHGTEPSPELSEHLAGFQCWRIPDPSAATADELRETILREDGDLVADACSRQCRWSSSPSWCRTTPVRAAVET